jgi:hypothetical protein
MEPFWGFKRLTIIKGEDMSNEKKIPNNEDIFIAELEASRTGEEHDTSKINPEANQAIEDLNRISKLFSGAKPDAAEIPDSVDNLVLGHIKQKSREIRRDRKVVHLFPRYKWGAAAVMGVLVCVISYNLIFKMNKPEDSLKTIPARSAEDIDGNGSINIIDAYIMDRRLMSGFSMSKKLDLNGDGYVNREDINTIVKTAVSLGKGEV